MKKKITKKEEFEHFTSIAKEWWLPEGKYKILHEIMPLRMKYITKTIGINKIKNLDILDLGCGGGLTSEPLARLKANVTGVDFIKENIKVALNHSREENLKIKYIHQDLDSLKINKKYDLILALEIIEHIDNWKDLIKIIRIHLKPKGKIIFSTINRTKYAKFFAIYIAENILNWVPKNTHSFEKLIKPDELKDELLKNDFFIKNLTGMNFNPLSREWELNENLYTINYFCTAQLSS